MLAEGPRSAQVDSVGASLPDWSNFPGAPLVTKGLLQLARNEVGREALAVLLAKTRLLGLQLSLVYDGPEILQPENVLYVALCRMHGDDAHAQFNAICREMVSFAEAMEAAVARMRRPENRVV